MKRVMCLYRVSTKGQVDPQDDIPMQRRECMDFISKQLDWKFVGELMEKGISGYKVSANKRDAILDMKAKAERKEKNGNEFYARYPRENELHAY